jgi:hypothetical protein
MKRQIVPLSADKRSLFATRKGLMIVLWAVRQYGPLSFWDLYKIIFGHDFYESEQRTTTERDRVLAGGGEDQIKSARMMSRYGANGHFKIMLEGILTTLQRSDLLDVSYAGEVKSPETMIVKVTPILAAVQNIFRISLTEFVTAHGEFLAAYPIFGEPLPPSQDKWADVFVIMPFDAAFRNIYDERIAAVARRLGLTCKRGDDFFSSQSIIDEVWSAIFHSEICIADCTGRNPNVFYELGVAHTLGRPVIIVTQDIDDIPFNISHRRIITYRDDPAGLSEFETSLAQVMRSELGIEGET